MSAYIRVDLTDRLTLVTDHTEITVEVDSEPVATVTAEDLTSFLRDHHDPWTGTQTGPSPSETTEDTLGELVRHAKDETEANIEARADLPTGELACPHCRSGDNLYSSETVTMDYPVRLARDENGDVEHEYAGEDPMIYDEGSEYRGDLFCRTCIAQLTEDELVETGANHGREG